MTICSEGAFIRVQQLLNWNYKYDKYESEIYYKEIDALNKAQLK